MEQTFEEDFLELMRWMEMGEKTRGRRGRGFYRKLYHLKNKIKKKMKDEGEA